MNPDLWVLLGGGALFTAVNAAAYVCVEYDGQWRGWRWRA